MRRFEFQVLTDDIRWDGHRLVAGGRCLSGPIFPGDAFTEVRVGTDSHRADLRVVEIRAYGQLLGELDQVVTAELLLEGDGGAPVENPSTLLGTSESE